MKNLAYQFYKGYFKDFESIEVTRKPPLNGWRDYGIKEKMKEKQNAEAIEKFFDKKHKPFLNAKISKLPRITSPGNYSFELETQYPGLLFGSGYTKGIGIVGEFKIGFQFDHTTGMPIIPGSSVKGTMRSVFPDIVRKEKNGEYVYAFKTVDEEKNDEVAKLKRRIINTTKTLWLLSVLDGLKNEGENVFLGKIYQPKEIELTQGILREIYKLDKEIFEGKIMATNPAEEDRNLSIYKRDIFHEAFPVKGGKDKIFESDSITPHNRDEKLSYEENMLKNPIPLLFLKVQSSVKYQFHFDIKKSDIDEKLTTEKKELLFQKILLTYGIGAKTNVGYGQFHNPYIIEDLKTSTSGTNDDANGGININTPIDKRVPRYSKKTKLRPGDKVEAQVIKSGEPNILKLYIVKGQEQEIELSSYKSALKLGTWIYAKVDPKGTSLIVNRASFGGYIK